MIWEFKNLMWSSIKILQDKYPSLEAMFFKIIYIQNPSLFTIKMRCWHSCDEKL